MQAIASKKDKLTDFRDEISTLVSRFETSVCRNCGWTEEEFKALLARPLNSPSGTIPQIEMKFILETAFVLLKDLISQNGSQLHPRMKVARSPIPISSPIYSRLTGIHFALQRAPGIFDSHLQSKYGIKVRNGRLNGLPSTAGMDGSVDSFLTSFIWPLYREIEESLKAERAEFDRSVENYLSGRTFREQIGQAMLVYQLLVIKSFGWSETYYTAQVLNASALTKVQEEFILSISEAIIKRLLNRKVRTGDASVGPGMNFMAVKDVLSTFHYQFSDLATKFQQQFESDVQLGTEVEDDAVRCFAEVNIMPIARMIGVIRHKRQTPKQPLFR